MFVRNNLLMIAVRSVALVGFFYCSCLEQTADGGLYVANAGNNSVLRYDTATGDYLGVFAAEQSATPVDIAFAPDGTLYLLSDGIYRYDGLTGALIDLFADSSASPISGPSAIALSSTPVPEPGTLAIFLGLGAFGVLAAFRHCTRNANPSKPS